MTRGTILVLVALAAPALAANLVILESEPGDPLGGGVERILDSTAGAFAFNSGHPTGGAFLAIEPPLRPFPTPDARWQLSFMTDHEQPPVVGQLDAGVRTGTFAPGRGPYVRSPLLAVECTESGAFLVSRIDAGRLDADFAVRCDGAAGALRGTVRYGAGDASCTGKPDGTPCDDDDACTTGEACRGERCDDGRAVECDDGDPGTDDLCGAREGCLHGRRWNTAGRLKATASGPGGTAHARVTLAGAADVRSDGTYAIAYGPCPLVPIAVPIERGRWREGHGRIELRATNRKELGRAFGVCLGFRHLRLRRLGGTARSCGVTTASADVLCVVERFRATVAVAGNVVALAGRARLVGPRVDRRDRRRVAGLDDG
jgi:hypothetical protein